MISAEMSHALALIAQTLPPSTLAKLQAEYLKAEEDEELAHWIKEYPLNKLPPRYRVV